VFFFLDLKKNQGQWMEEEYMLFVRYMDNKKVLIWCRWRAHTACFGIAKRNKKLPLV
jgi:hypothetical protein